MSSFTKFKKLVKKSAFLNKIYYSFSRTRFVKKMREKAEHSSISYEETLDSAPSIFLSSDVSWRPKMVGIVKDNQRNGYYEKFERFLKTNGISYRFYEPMRSDFFETGSAFDLIVWRISDKIPHLYFAKQKIEFIEKHSNTIVYPSYRAVWNYEEKVRQEWFFTKENIPHIRTFESNDYAETLQFLKTCSYPIISKESTSCSSLGVKKLLSYRKAKKAVDLIFTNGKKSTFSWSKQKDYVFFQEFVPNEGFDLRVIVIGKYLFGYYRYPKKKDFRASGSGIVVKKAIDTKALDFAREVYGKYDDATMLAVDMIQDSRTKDFLVVEASIFIGCETSQQLKVNDIPGVYLYENGTYHFQEGNFWIQEILLKVLFEKIDKSKKTISLLPIMEKKG